MIMLPDTECDAIRQENASRHTNTNITMTFILPNGELKRTRFDEFMPINGFPDEISKYCFPNHECPVLRERRFADIMQVFVYVSDDGTKVAGIELFKRFGTPILWRRRARNYRRIVINTDLTFNRIIGMCINDVNGSIVGVKTCVLTASYYKYFEPLELKRHECYSVSVGRIDDSSNVIFGKYGAHIIDINEVNGCPIPVFGFY